MASDVVLACAFWIYVKTGRPCFDALAIANAGRLCGTSKAFYRVAGLGFDCKDTLSN